MTKDAAQRSMRTFYETDIVKWDMMKSFDDIQIKDFRRTCQQLQQGLKAAADSLYDFFFCTFFQTDNKLREYRKKIEFRTTS
jgi:hypothetical protein